MHWGDGKGFGRDDPYRLALQRWLRARMPTLQQVALWRNDSTTSDGAAPQPPTSCLLCTQTWQYPRAARVS